METSSWSSGPPPRRQTPWDPLTEVPPGQTRPGLSGTFSTESGPHGCCLSRGAFLPLVPRVGVREPCRDRRGAETGELLGLWQTDRQTRTSFVPPATTDNFRLGVCVLGGRTMAAARMLGGIPSASPPLRPQQSVHLLQRTAPVQHTPIHPSVTPPQGGSQLAPG